MKCGNCLFGIRSHSGKYACLWCEGESSLEPGVKRTFGSLDKHFEEFVQAGSKKETMMDHKNVTCRRVIYLEENPETVIEERVPIPEQHILIGVVTHFGKALIHLWTGFIPWLEKNYIMFRGYQGVGFDGNNSDRFLKRLDLLRIDILNASQIDPILMNLIPIVDCLQHFQCVQTQAFGMEVGENLNEAVTNFKESYQSLILHLHEVYKYKLTITWKIHIACCHIEPLVKARKFGLGVFAEQAGEAIHHQFKKTWANYKRRINHEEYGIKLKKSVTSFGVHNI